MPNPDKELTVEETLLERLVDEVRRKRLEYAGADNYMEGYWHGIAIGMLVMLRLMDESKQKERKGAIR